MGVGRSVAPSNTAEVIEREMYGQVVLAPSQPKFAQWAKAKGRTRLTAPRLRLLALYGGLFGFAVAGFTVSNLLQGHGLGEWMFAAMFPFMLTRNSHPKMSCGRCFPPEPFYSVGRW